MSIFFFARSRPSACSLDILGKCEEDSRMKHGLYLFDFLILEVISRLGKCLQTEGSANDDEAEWQSE